MRSQPSKIVYFYVAIINCFLLILVSSVGSAWCFDLESSVHEDNASHVPNNCITNIVTDKPNVLKLKEERAQQEQTDCEYCIDYSFTDFILTGFSGQKDEPQFSLSLATEYQPVLLITLPQSLLKPEYLLTLQTSASTIQKSLQTIVLLI